MRAVDQWEAIRTNPPEGWEEARVSFVVEDSSAVPAAAAVLAPLRPGRVGHELRFHVPRSGSGRPRRALGCGPRRATAGLERPPLRARARLQRLRPPRRPSRSAAEPDPGTGGDRAPLQGLGEAGVRSLAGYDPALFR